MNGADATNQLSDSLNERLDFLPGLAPAQPMDGAYGWVVVVASFVVNMIADGVTFSFGIVLSELFQDLHQSRQSVSWIGSFLAGVPLLMGPVTSILIDRFGCRLVTMAGGLVSGTGFILMFWLPSSTLLFALSAGLVTGCGLGLCYMPAVVAVAFYFLEKRSLATGISVSGSGAGTLVFAYVTQYCLDTYAWRGAFLMLGGIMLNICVCGALFKPATDPRDEKRRRRFRKLYRSALEARGCSHEPLDSAQEFGRSMLSIPTYLSRHDNRLNGSGQPDHKPDVTSYEVRRRLFPVDRRYFMRHSRRQRHQSELWDSCPEFDTSNAVDETSSLDSKNEGAATRLARRFVRSKTARDMRCLFSSVNFVCFAASNFILYFWYDIAYTFLPDHAADIGLNEASVSLIIALIGVSNAIGQIVIGFIGDNPSVNTPLLYVICMSLTGVCNCLVPWCLSTASLLVYGVCYGFLVSANYALCSIVIIDLFSLERLTTGYGFVMFFQGLANLLGPPVMGHMRDADSNYNRAFIYSGIFMTASNILVPAAYRALAVALCRQFGCCRISLTSLTTSLPPPTSLASPTPPTTRSWTLEEV